MGWGGGGGQYLSCSGVVRPTWRLDCLHKELGGLALSLPFPDLSILRPRLGVHAFPQCNAKTVEFQKKKKKGLRILINSLLFGPDLFLFLDRGPSVADS